MDTSGIETGVGRTIRTLLEVRQETKAHFLVGTVILGFLSILKKSKASSPFEALNYVCLSRCQSDVIPPVQMRRRPTTFSRVSTGDSDIPSSCEMKHEPEFKPLQGSLAFFGVRVSRGPFHLRKKTQGPSHIHIAEGKLHLRCWWKVGSNLQSKTGNQLSYWEDMGCMELSSSCCTGINIYIELRRCLRESLSIPQGSQATCTVCCGTRDSYGANEGEMGFFLC